MKSENNCPHSYSSFIPLALLLFFISSFFFGCAGQPIGTLDQTDQIINNGMSTTKRNQLMGTMRQEGDNVKVDKKFEGTLDRVSSADARELCNQYCEEENFSKCRSCLDTYLQRDDVQTVLGRTCNNPGQFSPGSIGADFLYVIDSYEKRARMGIFFSDFPKAQENIDIYADLIQELEQCKMPKESSHYIRAAEIYALIGDRTGKSATNKVKIDRYLVVAKELANNSGDRKSKIISEINKAEILIHMATRNYKKALEILVDPKDYLNKTYAERTGESLGNRAGLIAGASFLAGIGSKFAGLSYTETALVTGGIAVAGILGTMIEEGVADIENLPYRNFQIAKCKYELKSYTEAKDKYELLLTGGKEKNDQVNLEVAYTDLGRIFYNEKSYANAAKYLKKAVSLIERYRSALNSDADKIGFIQEDRQKIYVDLVESLMQTGAVEEALEYAERGKSRALVDLLATKKEFGSDSNRDDYTIFIQQQQQAEEQIVRNERSNGLGTRSSEKNRNDRNKIKKSNSQLSSLVTVNGLKYSTIQSYLAKDETMLEYYGEDSRLYAFVVTRQDIHMEKIDTRNLAGLIDIFRGDIFEENRPYIQSAHDIHDRLIMPISKYLKTEKLIIVPHGSLHNLPFNALMDRDDRFFIEDHSIRMLPSASVLEFIKDSSSRNANMLILTYPYIDDYEPNQVELPGARKEGVDIARLSGTAIHLTGKEATKTVLKEYGDVPSILHIASHAEFDKEDALQSRLLLASDETGDGNLKVTDLYNMELNNYMVALSACETGLGKKNSGDNIIGLVRGFFFAGAESIVNTLWQISDKSSTTIMVDFYKNLAVFNKQEALRQAQLHYLKTQPDPDPYFWASYQITGAAGLPPNDVVVLDDESLSLSPAEKMKLAEFKKLNKDFTMPSLDSEDPARKSIAAINESPERSATRSIRKKAKTGKTDTLVSQVIKANPPPARKSNRTTLSSVTENNQQSVPDQRVDVSAPSFMSSREQSSVQHKRMQDTTYSQEKPKVDYDVKIVMNKDGKNDSIFLETAEKIPIALTLGSDSPYNYICLLVSDKSRGVLLHEIPVLVGSGSDYVVSSLKRPMKGWTKGCYEVVAMDKNRNIISRKEFHIVDSR